MSCSRAAGGEAQLSSVEIMKGPQKGNTAVSWSQVSYGEWLRELELGWVSLGSRGDLIAFYSS